MATKRKMRRFDEGGVTDEDLSAANATEDIKAFGHGNVEVKNGY